MDALNNIAMCVFQNLLHDPVLLIHYWKYALFEKEFDTMIMFWNDLYFSFLSQDYWLYTIVFGRFKQA